MIWQNYRESKELENRINFCFTTGYKVEKHLRLFCPGTIDIKSVLSTTPIAHGGTYHLSSFKDWIREVSETILNCSLRAVNSPHIITTLGSSISTIFSLSPGVRQINNTCFPPHLIRRYCQSSMSQMELSDAARHLTHSATHLYNHLFCAPSSFRQQTWHSIHRSAIMGPRWAVVFPHGLFSQHC